jgi:AraC-like DNA-binding protein
LLDASVRLLRLLDHPADVPVLAPLIEREILWRLLTGPDGDVLRQIGRADSGLAYVSRAIRWIRDNYAEPLRISDLAALAGMSPSAFHRHFRAVTAMSPLQFQKRIRLQEARSLLVSHAGDVAGVGHLVGYDSPTQFNREYRRLFGARPGYAPTPARSRPDTCPDLRPDAPSAASTLPPVEHPHCPERHPARRLTRSVVQVEPDPAGQGPVQQPGAVRAPLGTYVLNRIAQPRVRLVAGGAEIVQRPQYVVPPPIRMQEFQERLVRGLTRADSAEKSAFEQIFLTRFTGCSRFGRAAGGALVLQQPFQDVDRSRERRTLRAIGPLAVPAAVGQPLAHQSVDNGRYVDPEIGAVGYDPAIDAFLDLAGPERLITLFPVGIGAD